MSDEPKYIDVQVGGDFDVRCDCGWAFRTKCSDQLDWLVEEHEHQTGHHWPTEAEALLIERQCLTTCP